MVFAFDDLVLDTDALELRRGDDVVPMEPQAFDVLALLVEHRERVVTKDELLDTVWGTRFVSESTLTTRIKQARKAVGDDGRSQRLIKTAHGRGYRFVGAVERRADGTGVPSQRLDGVEHLLERDHELDVLSTTLARAEREGRGSVVLVAGEAGIGKSSLVQAFVATTGVARPLIGGCDDLASPRALGPLRDVAREPGSPLAAAFADGGDADSVLAATLDLLADGPAVLVIEDVHWADDATLDLLRLVGRRIDALPAVLVATYRDDELPADHPLRRVLGALGGPHVTRVRLAPLSRQAVGALVGGSPQGADEIWDATRGNPFFVTEVLSSPHEPVPSTVRDAVLSRLYRLSPEARRLVELVAVVPSRTERWLVERAGPDLGDALAEAEVAGVVHVDAEHVWFRHELARRAVESSLSRTRHHELHRAVLAELAARDDTDPARLVHHARHAGETDRMLEYAELAAASTLRLRAYRQTVDFSDLLLEHADRVPADRAADVLARRSYALYVLNRLEDSAACARQAVEAATDDRDRYVDALLILSRATYWADGPAAAAECARRALAALEGTDDTVRLSTAYADLARAHSNLATIGIVAEPDRRVVDAAERALALAESLGRTDLQSHALQYLGSGRLALGDERGFDDVEKAVVLAEVDPRDELPVRACVNAAGSMFRAGRLDEAERYVDLGLHRAEGGDFIAGEYRLELTRAAVQLASGRWDEAARVLDELIGRPGEQGMMRPLASSVLARLLARRGRPADAEAVLATAVADAMTSTEVRLVGPVAAAALEVAWLGGASDVSGLVEHALAVSRDAGHRASEGELVAYLRRAGHDASMAAEPPGPWAAGLAGDHRQAASAWAALGDRYEAALELMACPASAERAAGTRQLDELGAVGPLAALG
jgi:DNA-binding winged helix-turn-helix (wHTH) protein